MLTDVVGALQVKESLPLTVWYRGLEAIGSKRRRFSGELLKVIEAQRAALWRERVGLINYELFDQATPAFNWYALEELAKAARNQNLLDEAEHGAETVAFAEQALASQLSASPRPPSPPCEKN